jgi:GAF domain-containing protein
LAYDVHTSAPERAGAALVKLVGAAAEWVPGATHAGISVALHDALDTAATTSPYPTLLDVIQTRHSHGPCLDALRRKDVVRVDDLASDTRWPEFRDAVMGHVPIRSVLSLPMIVGSRTLGALNLFAEDAGSFGAADEEIALLFVTHASLAWNKLCMEQEFQVEVALRDRQSGRGDADAAVRFWR